MSQHYSEEIHSYIGRIVGNRVYDIFRDTCIKEVEALFEPEIIRRWSDAGEGFTVLHQAASHGDVLFEGADRAINLSDTHYRKTLSKIQFKNHFVRQLALATGSHTKESGSVWEAAVKIATKRYGDIMIGANKNHTRMLDASHNIRAHIQEFNQADIIPHSPMGENLFMALEQEQYITIAECTALINEWPTEKHLKD